MLGDNDLLRDLALRLRLDRELGIARHVGVLVRAVRDPVVAEPLSDTLGGGVYAARAAGHNYSVGVLAVHLGEEHRDV
jgi:hypothetical protein